MKSNRALSLRSCLWLGFSIPFGLMLIVMVVAGNEPFGNDISMLYSDMYHQYFPFWCAFGDAIKNGDGLLWNWSVGMGMDYLSLISYYLASPLNILSVIAPEGLELEFFSMLMPIKLGLAGLFFTVFLHWAFEKHDLSVCIFGAFYALCGWALAYQWNIMWLDTFALLPLTVMGTVKLLRDRKFILYTTMLFLSIFSNYYIGFFICIFILLLFFAWEICRWKGFGRFFADLFRIGWFTVIAIGMTAILELPALAGLQNTQSSVNAFPEGFRLNIADENTWAGLFDAMRQVAGNTLGGLTPSFKEGLPNLYCGVGPIMLSVIFLTRKEVRLRDKFFSLALLLFFMVSFIVRQLDYIWHGFHFTNMIPYRFSFLFSFVVLYMAYRAWLLREELKLWQLIAAGLAAGGLICASESRTDPVFLCFNIGFSLLYLVALWYFVPGRRPRGEKDPETGEFAAPAPAAVKEYEENRRSKAKFAYACMAGIFALELCLNVLNFGLRFSYTTVSNYPRGTTDTAAVISEMKELEQDTLFYRAETTHSQTLNDGALNGYHGVSTFTSSANVRITEFMKALGYGAKNTYNRYLFEESSPVSNLFLNLKYMIEREGDLENNNYFSVAANSGSVYLLENDYYLPLGFLAEQELAEVSFEVTDHFQLQNLLFSAATGLTEDVWYLLPEPEITGDGVTISGVNSSKCSYTGGTSGSSVTYTFTSNRDGFACLDFDVTDRNSYTVSVNGEELYSESLSLPQMIAVSDVSAGDVIEVKLTCKQGEEGRMTVKAGVLDAGSFYQGYEVLSRAQLELTEFSSTYVCGTVTCDRDGLLYTSIPQDGNWSATVDGEPAEIILVGDAMVSLMLTEGEHTVEFTYHNEAFSLGWKISAVSALLFAASMALLCKRKKGKYEKEK